MNKLSAVSLFSGAGGLDIGFEKAGFDIVFANDLDKNACLTYNSNFSNQSICGPIEEFSDDLINFKGVDCLFGGPPCQGFSVAGRMNLDDPRSQLVHHFVKVLGIINPRSFVMENVPSLATLEKFSHFRSQLFSETNRLGYKTELVILNSAEFGVPQARRRMFLFGIKEDFNIDILSRKNNYLKSAITTFQSIHHLGCQGTELNPKTCNADVTLAAKPVLRKSAYAGMLFNGLGRPIDPNVPSPTLPASMGGNKTPIIDEEQYYGTGFSWVEKYHKHLRNGGQPYGMHDAPTSLRRLTLKESAILHSYPKDFLFQGPKSSIYRQIGNSVPPGLSYVVAKMILELLKKQEVEYIDDHQLALIA